MNATDKDERIAQILETDVTREQLAEAVWSMERGYAGHVELIKELMDERAALRAEMAKMVEVVRCHDVSDVDGIFVCSECKCQIEGMTVLNGARRWVVPPYCPNCGRRVIE